VRLNESKTKQSFDLVAVCCGLAGQRHVEAARASAICRAGT
jgi:hypothetical protein